MDRPENVYDVPQGLPEPVDDGACDHLPGMRMPSVSLMSTAGDPVDLSTLTGATVVYCYPLTRKPDQDLPPGWDDIPGARGCTPQSCAFRDHHAELKELGARVFGLSTQDTPYQREAAGRLHLPFPLLSDVKLEFARALGLPTFEAEGMTLIKRLTLVIEEGEIKHAFYPVFPPGRNAEEDVEMNPVTTDILHKRLTELEQILAPHGSALVAFSGGVDSSLALAVAARALPKNRVLAVTSNNETYLPSELDLAREFAESLGVEHLVVNTRELDNPDYASNPTNRCYFCKSTLYSDLAKLAEQKGYACVVDGANKDDEGDYRPGRRAAREIGVVSVLSEAGMSKAEVRELARYLGLPAWDKPALACLSSRFPYGQEITPEKLSQVARAEEFMRAEGFSQVRVRHHGDIARLEVGPEELERAFAMREEISAELLDAGFLYVTLDLAGYKPGSLNAALKKDRSKKALPLISS